MLFQRGYGPQILLYADDTVLNFSECLHNQLEKGLNEIWKWCSINKLTINAAKTKYITARPKGNQPGIANSRRVKLGDTFLERVRL